MTNEFCAFCAPRDSAQEYPQPGPSLHPECGMRMVLGGIGHLTDHQHWCVEQSDPDMGLTYRESALLVWQWVQEHGIEAAAAVEVT